MSLCTAVAVVFACTAFEARSSDTENSLLTQSDRLDYFFFGGVLHEGDFIDSFIPFSAPLEDNYLLGIAINYAFLDAGRGFHFGGEVGIAGRFGDGTSAEVWGGPSIRYDGIEIGPVSIGLGVVAGLSAVTEPIGIEKEREEKDDGDSTLVYYLGPEISFRSDRLPDTELVLRAHHRSGGRNVSYIPTLGNIGEASNAYVIGVRFTF